MSHRSSRADARRAEARRRARLAARGVDISTAEETDEAAPASQRPEGGFLRRLFPPAPPLPDKGDPLAGYTGSGPLRPITSRLYLLVRNPLAWIGPGVVWALARMTDPNSVIGLIGLMLSFASLVAAGWFGWQRPALFGTAAAVLGFGIFVGVVYAFFAGQGATPDLGAELSALVYSGLVQAGIGFISGWYGGYLRRRAAQVKRPQSRAPRR